MPPFWSASSRCLPRLRRWCFTREHLGGRVLLGAALIFAGILLAEWKGTPESHPGEIPA